MEERQTSIITLLLTDVTFFRAHYADGVLAPAKPGLSLEPKPCAGNDGTIITVCINSFVSFFKHELLD
jgi:hypothetical protein